MILEKNVKQDQKNLNSISYSECKNRNLKKKRKIIPILDLFKSIYNINQSQIKQKHYNNSYEIKYNSNYDSENYFNKAVQLNDINYERF